MVKSYLKHPLLSNPSKWLTTPRSHINSLYQSEFYDTAALNNNPFALALQETGHEKLKLEFPTGNLVRIVVEPPPELQVVAQIKPILESIRDDRLTNSLKPGFVETPPTYGHLLKNYHYVQYLVKNKLWNVNLPEELRFRNSNKHLAKCHILPTFMDEINNILVSKITELLSAITESNSSPNSPYLKLILDPENNQEFALIDFENPTPIVNLGKFLNLGLLPNLDRQQSICLAYNQHPNLCFYLISLVDYNRK